MQINDNRTHGKSDLLLSYRHWIENVNTVVNNVQGKLLWIDTDSVFGIKSL